MNIDWEIKKFEELSVFELYTLMQLRQAVFTVEQNCAYQDADGKDLKCFHLMGYNNEKELIAYSRIVPAGISFDEVSIGRVISSDKARGTGAGKALMKKSKDFIETNLNSFVESRASITFDELKAIYKNFDIKIEFDLVQANAKVCILPPELGDVISEIIDNSFYILNEKYNTDKSFTPKIDVSTLLFENNVILKIRDNGKGIPPRDLQQIFSPFFTTKPTSKGSGLGLFMSKDIIELHKGKINIYSQEGIFTEITIQLPTIINPILTS